MRAGACRFRAGRERKPRASRRAWSAAFALVIALIGSLSPAAALAQSNEITEDQLEWVFPDASRFSSKEGDPPVYRAFTADAGS